MKSAATTVVVAALLAGAAGCSTPPAEVVPDPPPATSSLPAAPPTRDQETVDQETADQPGPTGPSRVVIASIGLDEPMIDLGLAADGSMEVPTDYGDVGWFTGGGRPGGFGPTVVAGHVDSTTGPAVFSRLSEVAEGDVVQLAGEDGRTYDYRIYRVSYVAKDAFPTAEVFSALRVDEVRVITCAGEFDRDAGKYDQNMVVFGSRV